MADVYWVTTEGPCVLLGVCLPPMLNLGRHIKANYLSPMASSISQARLKYGSSRNTSRSQTVEYSGGTQSVYQGAGPGQAQYSTTKLHPSERELESIYNAPGFAYTRSESPQVMQPQSYYPPSGYPQGYYPESHYVAPVTNYDNTASAPLAVPEHSIRVDSNFTVSHQPYY